LRILPKPFYASLETLVDSNPVEHLFGITDDLVSLLKTWRASTRISPIWKLNHKFNEDWYRDSNKEAIEILFISATDPAWLINNISTITLRAIGPDDLWMSIGAYNIIAVCYDDDVVEDICSTCENAGISMERWWVDGTIETKFRIDNITLLNPVEFSIESILDEKPAAALAFERAELPDDDTLNFMILEMYALTSAIESRSQSCFPNLRDDVMRIEKVAAKLVPDGEFHYDPDHQITNQKKRDLLLSLNAGLSRLASQALSGTTPITQTECHFWPHSFLGTGVANVALRNVTEFLTEAVRIHEYNARYEAILSRQFKYEEGDLRHDGTFKIPYCNLKNSVVYNWTSLAEELTKHERQVANEDVFFLPNPITYFSGRDGFKNTFLTTSAPLMCVSGANCVRWNLGTISHELSHRIISGKLERLFKSVRRRCKEINGFDEFQSHLRSHPSTKGEYSENLLIIFLANRVHEQEFGRPKSEIKKDISELVTSATRQNSRYIEEMLVHIFDFYHFYGADADNYVEYVWQSWAVQPSIQDKMDEYILRTVVALSIARFEHEDFHERALGDFDRICESPTFRDNIRPFIDVLTTRLSNELFRSNLLSQVYRCSFLLSLFSAVFKSENLKDYCSQDSVSRKNTRSYRTHRTTTAKALEQKEHEDGWREPTTDHYDFASDFDIEMPDLSVRKAPLTKRVSFNYTAKKRVFYDDGAELPVCQFRNPLLFLRDFSRDADPNAAVSAWLLSHLAFNWSWTEVDGGPDR